MDVRFGIIFGIVLIITYPGYSIDIFTFLGRAYRKNLIQFYEDPLFGNKSILNEYDFIVIGAGAAGATVARRLAEVPEWNVLLLEAGGEESLITAIPIIAHYLHSTKYNWAYHTEKEIYACRGHIKNICLWPQGKGLGGSTIINGNMFTRGYEKDYNRWAEAGNLGWSYNDILPYFLKIEDINIPEMKRSLYHGVGGQLPISYPLFKSKLADAFLESASEIGIKVGDHNAPGNNEIFSRIQSTTLNGRRITSARAYLQDNLPNLHILEYGYVTKLLIDENTKSVYGVEFIKNKITRKVLAIKEVIVSAGTFNSAKLLMLSGIGPKEHLDPLGIKTVSDLRVGDNLQEHPAFAGLSFIINNTVSFVPDRELRNSISEVIKAFDKGSWLSILPVEAVGYVKTKYSNNTNDLPDIGYIFSPGSVASDAGLGATMIRRSMGIPDRLYYNTYAEILNKDMWTIWPMLMYPESRGQVRLRSDNPFDKPVINANFFTKRIDLYRIIEGIKMAAELSKTKAFQKYGSKLHETPMYGCRHLDFGTDEYWACCIETMTMQMHHQCGTCKMGPESDRNAVVNSQLKVYGVNKLRVIDCSIMPTITGAHTVAPAYMIGEKGADLIKSTWL